MDIRYQKDQRPAGGVSVKRGCFLGVFLAKYHVFHAVSIKQHKCLCIIWKIMQFIRSIWSHMVNENVPGQCKWSDKNALMLLIIHMGQLVGWWFLSEVQSPNMWQTAVIFWQMSWTFSCCVSPTQVQLEVSAMSSAVLVSVTDGWLHYISHDTCQR